MPNELCKNTALEAKRNFQLDVLDSPINSTVKVDYLKGSFAKNYNGLDDSKLWEYSVFSRAQVTSTYKMILQFQQGSRPIT